MITQCVVGSRDADGVLHAPTQRLAMTGSASISCRGAEVNPGDDSICRYVVSHYRYDPSRRERRNVVVAAFDNAAEYEACIHREAQALSDRKAAGEVTDRREHISGTVHSAGHRWRQQNARMLHRALRRGVIPPNLDNLELPSNVGIMRPRSRDGFTYWCLTALSRLRQVIGARMRAWLRRRERET